MRPLRNDTLVLAADLVGTLLFAIEGAVVAMRSGLDLLGVMVMALVSALGGGVIRDLLIGASPPSAIRDWRYPVLTFAAGFVAFVFHGAMQRFGGPAVIVLDAAGLALFAVAGAEKASQFGIKPFVAALMGTITGVGGGFLRDILLAKIPAVLVTDIYATAAFIGAAALVILRRRGWSATRASFAGGLLCFAVRLLAVWQHWQLPKAPVW